MGPDFVVVFAPLIDLISGFFEISKPMHVQTVFPELATERFDKRILGWLAGLDELQRNVPLLCPEKHRLTG